MFDFQLSNDVQLTNSSKRRLAPWEIYTVKLTNAEITEVQSKADPTTKFKLIRIRFENDEGYYDESIFFPTEQDSERKTFERDDGGTFTQPSNWERTKMFIYISLIALNPEGLKKFQAASAKFKNFDMMAAAYVKVLTEAIGTEVEIKLGGRKQKDGTISAAFPKFINIGNNGEVYVSSNIIGQNLFFSAYEEKQRTAFKNAKPTVMPDLVSEIPTTESETDNSMKVDDITDLLAELS